MLVATTWTLDFNTTDLEKLEDVIYVNKILTSIIDTAAFTIVSNSFKKFKPIGLTSFFLLEESHLSIHTWPEYNCFCIDIFTCKPLKDIEKVVELIESAFENTKLISKSSVERKTSANIGLYAITADGTQHQH